MMNNAVVNNNVVVNNKYSANVVSHNMTSVESVYNEFMQMLCPNMLDKEREAAVVRSLYEINVRKERIQDEWKAFRASTNKQVLIPQISLTKSGKANITLIYRDVVPQLLPYMQEVNGKFFNHIRQCKDGYMEELMPDARVAWNILQVEYRQYKEAGFYGAASSAFRTLFEKDALVSIFMESKPLFRNESVKYTDLRDGKEYSADEFKATFDTDPVTMDRYSEAGLPVITKNGLKNNVMLLVRDDVAESTRQYGNLADMGMLKSHTGEELPVNQFLKLATRASSHMSPEFGQGIALGAVAVYMGKYAQNKADGESFTLLLPQGQASHNRAYTEKDQLIGVNDSLFTAIIEKYAKNVVWYIRKNGGEQKQEIMDNLKRSSKSLEESIVIIADYIGQVPEIFGDLNSFKEAWDIDGVSGFNSQGLYTDTNKKDVKVSGQTVFKALATDAKQEFGNLFLEIFAKHVRIAIERRPHLVKDAETFLDVLHRDPATAMQMIDPQAEFNFPWLRKKALSDLTKTLSNMINGMFVHVDGRYVLAQVDPSVMFEIELLDSNEVIMDEQLLQNKSVLLFKDPTIGLNEYQEARVVSKSEYKARVIAAYNANKINLKTAQGLCDYVEFMCSAAIIVSGNDIVKCKLAGFDFDTDHLRVIVEESVVQFFRKHVKSVAVKIDASQVEIQDDGKRYTVGYNLMAQAANILDTLGIKDIGTVTNTWQVIQAMYINNDLSGFKKFVTTVLGNNGRGTKTYKPFCVPQNVNGELAIEIGLNKIRDMVDSAKKMALTEENLQIALLDFVIALPRHDQELIIDAVGHGYQYHILGDEKLERKFIAFVKEMKESDRDVKIAIRDKDVVVDRHISDFWGEIKALQNAMIHTAAELLTPEVEKAYSGNITVDSRIIHECVNRFNKLPETVKWELNRTLNSSTAISMLWRSRRKSGKFDQDEVNKIYASALIALENEFRCNTMHLDAANRFAVLIALTQKGTAKLMLKGGILESVGRQIFKEEMAAYLFATTQNDTAAEIGEQIDWDILISIDKSTRLFLLRERNTNCGSLMSKELTRANSETAKAATGKLFADGRKLRLELSGHTFHGEIPSLHQKILAYLANKEVKVCSAYYCGSDMYAKGIVVLNIQ